MLASAAAVAAAALTTDSSSSITCLSSIAADAAPGGPFLRCCLLVEEEELVEVLELPDPDGEVLLTGRCAELRLLVDGCRRGSVSCSVYASEWTNARVSYWLGWYCCCP